MTRYVCDASSLIWVHRCFQKRCTKPLRRMAQSGSLKLPEGIVREIRRGTDRLAEFVKKNESFLIVRIGSDPRTRDELARLEKTYGEVVQFGHQQYPGFWSSPAGREAADGQVVAVAKMLGAVAVSEDQAVKLACALEGVECIGWSEFARRVGLVSQLPLVDEA